MAYIHFVFTSERLTKGEQSWPIETDAGDTLVAYCRDHQVKKSWFGATVKAVNANKIAVRIDGYSGGEVSLLGDCASVSGAPLGELISQDAVLRWHNRQYVLDKGSRADRKAHKAKLFLCCDDRPIAAVSGKGEWEIPGLYKSAPAYGRYTFLEPDGYTKHGAVALAFLAQQIREHLSADTD